MIYEFTEKRKITCSLKMMFDLDSLRLDRIFVDDFA